MKIETKIGNRRVPSGNILMVHPPYVHSSREFVRDRVPFLPIGLLYAGQILEEKGARVSYQDCQLHDMDHIDVSGYDSIGINVMGTQNIAPAYRVFASLLERGTDPTRVYFGGQGVEGLTEGEFERIFPHANLVNRRDLFGRGYLDVSVREQLGKFSEEDLDIYLRNELTLLFSQGCVYNCTFCGAQTAQIESFYNTGENLRTYFDKAKELGISNLEAYVTSLDFFQQAQKGGEVGKLKRQLQDIVDLKRKYGLGLRLRALTRADSYTEASKDSELMDLVRRAGFYQFGFGADGAANTKLLRAMHKGTTDLGSNLLDSFSHAEKSGFTPEILYVFGIEEDTEETLRETRDFCRGLLNSFPTSIYRGFPAKNQIPGNLNWMKFEWKNSIPYDRLLANPELFGNLGFETLANSISHPDVSKRKTVNKYAIEMSHTAHELGRVQSFLTVPTMDTDGHELMDETSFQLFREIIRKYAPKIADVLTLDSLPIYREQLNEMIPKDT